MFVGRLELDLLTDDDDEDEVDCSVEINDIESENAESLSGDSVRVPVSVPLFCVTGADGAWGSV